MRILVIEDNPVHAAGALQQLGSQHDVTVIQSIDEAWKHLQPVDTRGFERELDQIHPGWKVVRWSEWTPMAFLSPEGRKVTVRDRAEYRSLVWPTLKPYVGFPYEAVLTDCFLPKGGDDQEAILYGPAIALQAIQLGAKFVGLLTDAANHGQLVEKVAAGFRFSSGGTRVEGRSWYVRPGESKDWRQLLKELLGEKDKATDLNELVEKFFA